MIKKYISDEFISVDDFLVLHVLEFLQLDILPKRFQNLNPGALFHVDDLSQIFIDLKPWRVEYLGQHQCHRFGLLFSLRELIR